jgi:DNA-binding transcriptional ArsR family regulator
VSAAASAQAARVFAALADPTRRTMVEMLANGPLAVSRLASPFAITLTAVGQHLRVLEESGLVRTQKIGRVRTCRIETKGFAVIEEWISHQRALWDQRLDRLGDVLDEDSDENSS